MSELAIRFDHVTKRYRIGASRYRSLREDLSYFFRVIIARSEKRPEILALDNASFDLSKGKSLGIIGPNGAGKTTILKLISRITRPSSGNILVNGRLASLIEIGAGFHPELTGRENIFLYGSILGLKHREIKKRFAQIVEFSGIDRFIDTPAKRYSNGMYLRLAFSVAAHVEPEILLVDEVLAVGDAAFQRRCLKKIKETIQQGVVVVFVTHNLHLITILANKVLYINKGSIRYIGEEIGEGIKKYLIDINKAEDLVMPESGEEILMNTEDQGRILNMTLNQSNQFIPSINMQDAVSIYLQYRLGKEIKDPHISITLWTDDGILVTTADTRFGPVKINFLDRGIIECKFLSLKLLPGRYYVKAYLLDGLTNWTVDSFGWKDNRMCGFIVEEQVIKLNTGIDGVLEKVHHGLVWEPVQWNSK